VRFDESLEGLDEGLAKLNESLDEPDERLKTKQGGGLRVKGWSATEPKAGTAGGAGERAQP
jgi:hypothetical protein